MEGWIITAASVATLISVAATLAAFWRQRRRLIEARQRMKEAMQNLDAAVRHRSLRVKVGTTGDEVHLELDIDDAGFEKLREAITSKSVIRESDTEARSYEAGTTR